MEPTALQHLKQNRAAKASSSFVFDHFGSDGNFLAKTVIYTTRSKRDITTRDKMLYFTVLLIASLLMQGTGQFRDDNDKNTNDAVSPNVNWHCEGCNDAYHAMDIFNQIHSAVRHNDRLSYLGLDMSWMDRLNQIDSHVHVQLNDFNRIASVHPPESIFSEYKKSKSILSEYTEEFQVLAFHFNQYQVADRGRDESTLQRKYQAAIDAFLALNPCWIPLHEPYTPPLPAVISASTSKSNRYENTASNHHNKRSLQSTHPILHHHPLGEKNNHQHGLLLFIRLPDVSFHATCMLYTAVIKRQFPRVCHYTPETMRTYHLANIGFGHVSLFIVNSFSAMLKEFTGKSNKDQMVFIAPRAQASTRC